MTDPVNVPISIRSETIDPGRSRRFEVPVARLITGTWESVPVAVINGRRPGPHVFLTAAVHGDEINGVEIVRRVLRHLDARKLAGAVVAVPVVNVFGFVNHSRYLPDRRDLNRSFPGSKRGSMASRLAQLVFTDILGQCEFGIDLHTAAHHRVNIPQIRANLDDPDTYRLARAFGAPFSIHARLRDGSLRQAADERGTKVLLYEAGSPMRFERDPIETGVAGVLRVLSALEMGTWKLRRAKRPIELRKTTWARATRGGIATLDVSMGDAVTEGDRIGEIGDALGGRPTGIRATASGYVIAVTQNPLVSQGEALVHIGVPGAEGRDEPAEKARRRKG